MARKRQWDAVIMYDAADGIRWRFLAGENGRLLADSGQAYTRQGDALHAAARVVGPRRLRRILIDRTGTPA